MARAMIFIDGNAGMDAEIRFSKSGKPWAKFSVAVTESVKTDDGFEDGDTTWFDIIAFNRLAEEAAEYVRKGVRVSVYGRFKLEKWTGDDGVVRTTAIITADSIGVMPRLPQANGSHASKTPVEAPW